MSTEVLTQALTAGQPATFGRGSMVLITSLTSPVTVVASQIGNSNKKRVFSNVTGGFKFQADSPDDGFDTLTVTSAASQNISIAIGDDDVDFANAVTVSNVVATQDSPAATLTDAAPVTIANGTQGAVVPVNASRRRVLLTIDPNNAAALGSLFFRKAGGAQNLLPVTAGQSYGFNGTYGIDLNNTSGVPCTVYVCEES